MPVSSTCLIMSEQVQNTIDQNKIQQFMNKAVGDIAVALYCHPCNYWRKTWLV